MPPSSADAGLSGLRSRIFFNFLTAISRGMKFVFYILIGNLLGEKVLGLFLLSWSTMEFGSRFLMMGLDLAVFRELAISIRFQQREAFEKTFVTAVKIYGSVGLLFVLLMLPASQWIAELIYLKPELRWGLAWLALAVFCQHSAKLFTHSVMADKNMRAQFFVLGVAEPLFSTLAVVLAGVSGEASLTRLAMFYAGGNFCMLAIAFIVFCLEYKVRGFHRWFFQYKVSWGLLRISIPLGLAELTSNGLIKLPLFVFGRLYASDVLPTFAICHQVAHSVMTLRTALAGSIYPYIGEFSVDRNFEIIRGRLVEFTNWSARFIVPLMALLMIFDGPVLQLLNVRDPHAHRISAILVPTLCLFAVFSNTEYVLLMLRRGWRNVAFQVTWMLFFTGLYFKLGQTLRLEDLCWVYMIQILSMSGVYAVLLLREHRSLHPLTRRIIPDFTALACVLICAQVVTYAGYDLQFLNWKQAAIPALIAAAILFGTRWGVNFLFQTKKVFPT